MAVKAPRLGLFPPHMLPVPVSEVRVEGNGKVVGDTVSAGTETMSHVYGSVLTAGLVEKRPDNEVMCSRKRPRELMNSGFSGGGRLFTFLGDDISVEIQNQTMEIDRFLAHHIEVAEIRKHNYFRRIATAMQQKALNKLKEKDEQIEKVVKLNFALEDRVKSLVAENRLWRDIARYNEAAANALRLDINRILSEVADKKHRRGGNDENDDDAASYCGSNDGDVSGGRICRWCRRQESCVLILPCSHLCICASCVSAVRNCPLCESPVTSTLHVNASF